MQIQNGRKTREDFNEFAYSKGSVYGEYSLDRQANMLQACLSTANANDYSGAQEELNTIRMKVIAEIVDNYPPHFIPVEDMELLEADETYMRWNLNALVIKSNDLVGLGIIKRKMDYSIVKSAGLDTSRFDHHTREFKDKLKETLAQFWQTLNNPTG